MLRRGLIFALAPLPFVATAQQAPPEKALKYHEALLKRPHNAALFDRFFGAWIDELPVDTLGTFLSARAQANGGQDWTVLALYQLRRGQEDEALASMAKAIEAVPDDLALPMDRAKVRLRRLEFDAARKDLTRVAEGKDEALALEAAKLLGKSWLREGKSAEAVKAWDAILRTHPNDEDLLEDLVETAAAEGETAQALSYIDKLVELGGDPYKKTLRRMRKGDILALAGRNDEAVDAYAATLELVGEGSWLEREVLAQIEKNYRKQDQLDELSARLKKLSEANPRRLLIHRQLAKLEASQGEVDSAIGRFREVLQRSPGDRELREEFIRLLSDSDRLDDAAAEIDKLVQLAPTESSLHLQLAAVRQRQGKADAVLAELRKAHELLGKEEGPSLRIAGLMLQYGQNAAGEELLKTIAATQGAGPAATEALAAHYGRTDRKAEAVELLKKVAAADDADVVIRATSSVAALGENETAFTLLTAKAEKFASEPRFLAALSQSALAAGKASDAVSHAVKLVRLAKQTTELSEGVNLAVRVITTADKVNDWRTTLEGQASRSPAETCLLAALIESQGDRDAVTKLLDPITDPLVVHFHAALLDVRGDFDQAIVVLMRLAETDEGRKAAYFKDLAELQQRAGKTSDALATVERWKQSAPGDKTAWVTGSRLLRESGKPEEAVKMARQAVARFEGDVDLAASLASLQDEAGQYGEAEAIYWRLYDEAQSPSDQTRWASQLAQLATKVGRTDELEEKLRERARSNRRSIGPVLAQAELARLSQNEEKYRELLLEAVRLQPKDIDLRLQIANLEEQSGNADRVVAVLEEAVPNDTTGRIRSALAQAYLRQGQTLKGMRELRAISGKQASDPRSIESSASTLAGANMYDEAIQFMRGELPEGGDWRSRYLLALMLEEDGRETEALPIFLSVLRAEGEIPSLNQTKPNNPYTQYWKQFKPELQELFRLGAAGQAAYFHKQNGRHYGSGYQAPGTSKVGPFALPDTPKDARTLALIHLLSLAKKANAEQSASIRAQMKAAGETNAEFIADLTEFAAKQQSENPQKLWEKYPNQPGMLDWVLMYASHTQLDPALMRSALEKSKDLSPMSRLNGWMVVAKQSKADDPAWSHILDAAKEGIENSKPEEIGDYCRLLTTLYSGTDEEEGGKATKCPDAHRETVKKLTLAALDRMEKEKKEAESGWYRLQVARVMGTQEEWLQAFSKAVQQYRQAPRNASSGSSQYNTTYSQLLRYSSMQGYNPWSSGQADGLFTPPNLDTIAIRSVPMGMMLTLGQTPPNYSTDEKSPMTLEEILKKSSDLESPFLRAWVAMKVGKPEAIQQALAATPLKGEESDFECLKAIKALQDKKPAEALAALERARIASASDREYIGWLNTAMLGVASQLSAEERTRSADTLSAVLTQCRQMMGPQSAPALASQATALGLEDLAKRLQPPAVAKASASSQRAATFSSGSRSSGSSGSGSIEKLKKFITDQKHDAAAREALQLIRSASANSWSSARTAREIATQLDEKSKEELLKIVDPGDSKSLTKRIEYADIAALLNKREITIKTLEALLAERPEDAAIASRLVFALPVDQADRRRDLMNRSATDEEFVSQAINKIEGFSNERDAKVVIDFYDAIATWLEGADPASLEKSNLTWAGYSAKQFFDSMYQCKLPDLLDRTPSKSDANKEVTERRVAVAKRLALALLRHPGVAEEGFRLLKASNAWKLSPEELDDAARKALACIDSDEKTNRYPYFSLVRSNGSSRSGDGLDRHSSVNYLVSRIGETKNADAILPSAYREPIRKRDAKIGEMIDLLAELKSADQLSKVLDTEAPDRNSNPYMSRNGMAMLRQGLMERAGSLAGSRKFFLDRISKLEFDQNPSRMYQQLQSHFLVYSAALNAGLAGSDEDLNAICTAISKSLFGEKPNWEKPESPQAQSYKIDHIRSLLQQQRSTAATTTLRLYRAWHQAGLPTNGADYDTIQSFQQRFAKPEEAEKFLESIGWLCDAAQWSSPMMYWEMRADHQGSSQNIVFTRQEQSMFTNVCSQLTSNSNISRSDLIKRLKERKVGRFGSLITAAAMSNESERQTLATQAFSECAAEIVKLSPEKLDQLSFIVPWVSPETAEKLPPKLKERLKKTDEKRRQDLLKSVEKFLAQPAQPSRYGNPFDQTESLIRQLVEVDLDKAVEVFVECERRFTTGLAQGSRLSSYTSNDFQVTERDEALNSILLRSSSSDRANPDDSLQFLHKLQKHPEAARLSYSPQAGEGYSSPIAELGTMLRNKIPNEKKNSNDPTLYSRAVFELVRSKPEEIRRSALIAICCSEFENYGSVRGSFAKDVRKDLEPLRKDFPQEFPFLEIRSGVVGWDGDTPEGRDITKKAVLSVLNDQAIPEPLRVCLALSCVKRAPGLLATTDVAPVIAELYERYCATERSAVNGWAAILTQGIGSAELTPESQPSAKRMLDAFWKNANSPRVGGHPVIAPSLASSLFSASARVGDETNAKRLLAQTNGSLAGNIVLISNLITAGQYELAKGLLPNTGQPYPKPSQNLPSYTKKLDENMPKFLATLEDPVSQLRIQAQLLPLRDAEGENAPKTNKHDSVMKLAAAYKANPPKTREHQMEILRQISNNDQLATVELADELIAWAKDCDYKATITSWISGSGNNYQQNQELYRKCEQTCELMTAAAIAGMERGDTSILEKATDAIIQSPILSKDEGHEYRGSTDKVMRWCHTSLVNMSSLWITLATARDHTTGFEKALACYEKLALATDGRFEFEKQQVHASLANCHFLSYWIGQPQRFEQLVAQMKTRQAEAKSFSVKDSIVPLVTTAATRGAWKSPYFHEIKKQFLIRTLRKESLTAIFPPGPYWLDKVASSGMDQSLTEISEKPDDFLPCVRAQLYWFRGKKLINQKKPDEAIAIYRQGIEAALPGADGDPMRGACKYALVKELHAQKKTDEAKQLLESIKPEESLDWIRGPYNKLITELKGPAPASKPAPSPTPAPAPATPAPAKS